MKNSGEMARQRERLKEVFARRESIMSKSEVKAYISSGGEKGQVTGC
jgi:hypothetical protein